MIRRTSALSFTTLCLASLCAAALCIGSKADEDTTSLEGKVAPAFSATTLDGKTISLASEKGNVVLMDFWATWCPPCKASLPHIQELANDKDLAAKGLKVWAVDTNWRGDNKEKAEKFVKANKYTFTVPLDTNDAAHTKFLVSGIPTTVLIGRDGMIKKVFVGFDPDKTGEMKSAIEEALKQPTKPS